MKQPNSRYINMYLLLGTFIAIMTCKANGQSLMKM